MKFVDTPVGKVPMPASFEEDISKLSDDELVEQLINDEKETGFINPFKLQFVLDKGLYAKYLRLRKEKI